MKRKYEMSKFKSLLTWDEYQQVKQYVPVDLWDFYDLAVKHGIVNKTPTLRRALHVFNIRFPDSPIPKILKGVKHPIAWGEDARR